VRAPVQNPLSRSGNYRLVGANGTSTVTVADAGTEIAFSGLTPWRMVSAFSQMLRSEGGRATIR
jgi:hypothetical protein